MDEVIRNVCTVIRLSSRLRLILFSPLLFWTITLTPIQRSINPSALSCGFQSETQISFQDLTKKTNKHKSICHRFTVYKLQKKLYNIKVQFECVAALLALFMTRGASLNGKEEAWSLFHALFSNTFLLFYHVYPKAMWKNLLSILSRGHGKKQDQYMHKDWQQTRLNSQSGHAMNKRWSCGTYSCDVLFTFLPSPFALFLKSLLEYQYTYFFIERCQEVASLYWRLFKSWHNSLLSISIEYSLWSLVKMQCWLLWKIIKLVNVLTDIRKGHNFLITLIGALVHLLIGTLIIFFHISMSGGNL